MPNARPGQRLPVVGPEGNKLAFLGRSAELRLLVTEISRYLRNKKTWLLQRSPHGGVQDCFLGSQQASLHGGRQGCLRGTPSCVAIPLFYWQHG